MTNISQKSNVFVTDPISKLDWKRCIEGKFELDEAVQKFGEPDQDGWRLPTIEELKTLIKNKRVTDGLDKHELAAFWSSSRHEVSTKSAWTISFYFEHITYHFGKYLLPVRLVRFKHD
jgi:Protein of unknown function (DUF1566)